KTFGRRPVEKEQVERQEQLQRRQIWQPRAAHELRGQLAGAQQQQLERAKRPPIEASDGVDDVLFREVEYRVRAVGGALFAAFGAERRAERGAAGDASLRWLGSRVGGREYSGGHDADRVSPARRSRNGPPGSSRAEARSASPFVIPGERAKRGIRMTLSSHSP